MYKKRLYTFVLLCALAVGLCILRLAQLQLIRGEDYRRSIEEARILIQLPTIRGRILDRDKNILAVDTAAYKVYIEYSLTRLLDERYWRCAIASRMDEDTNAEQAELKLRESLEDAPERIEKILEVCSGYRDGRRAQLEKRIRKINEPVWKMREFIAWRRLCRNTETAALYESDPESVLRADMMEDFAREFPDERKRSRILLEETHLAEMEASYRLMELVAGEEVFLAQNELAGIKGVTIGVEAKRKYPYRSAASQIIGWVGPVPKEELGLFDPNETRLKYLTGEVCGRDGVEQVCEIILRGQRGEVTLNDVGERLEHKETRFGQDVSLSLDIKLQQRIESFLSDPNENPHADTGIGAVVIDVAGGDILAMVSIPVFDLNTLGLNYDKLLNEAANQPLWNKSLAKHYPPGSTVKPILLTAALEERKLRPDQVISCPSQKAPEGWPNCPIFLESTVGHDIRQNEGISNTARNAIRFSCNVFFSKVANKLEPKVFQRWFFNFGYGHRILDGPFGARNSKEDPATGTDRFLRESGGFISSKMQRRRVTTVDDLGALYKADLKQFGVGQGNFRATVLQVANAAAVIARGGIYKSPRLFLNDSDSSNANQVDLKISSNTLSVVREGMRAAVTEKYGTGYSAFANSGLDARDVKVFGKTGSTQEPENAWFMCFAEDPTGRAISLAIVVEGGQSGSKDAAPLARRILEFCNEAGHIGKRPAR